MRRLRHIAIGAVGVVLGLFVLLLSGVLNFAASSGHWDVTDWVMDLATRQSVTLRSLGIDAPALEDQAMIRRGAGHYELVCAACHGSPAQLPEAFARNLTPQPPLLAEQMQHWRPPARTFWTVKHGIKRTAMPAWPTQLRDDEVWDVVAFIETMPKLTADEYRDLVGERDSNLCESCHGEDGAGRDGTPRLDIQSPAYLAAALRAYRNGTRASGTMMSVARVLTDQEIGDLANRYGRMTTIALPEDAPELWTIGDSSRDIAGCASCHGPGARLDFPRLAGQDPNYLARQLTLFTDLGTNRGGQHAEIMARAARALTPAEIDSLAAWLRARI